MSIVMSFGEGWNGALGLPFLGMGKGAKAYEPTTIPFLPSDIVSIFAGHLHSLALTSLGQLWATTCTPNSVVALLIDDGALLSCGTNYNGQLGRDFPYSAEQSKCLPVELSFRVTSVAAGTYHSMAICQLDESNGANVGTTKVASWGWNRHFELGRYGGGYELPSLIDGLDGENPVSISAGLAHSLALTSKGKLWVWSSCSDGTLGFKSPRVQCEPYYLDSLERFQILQVVAGHYHNLVLVSD